MSDNPYASPVEPREPAAFATEVLSNQLAGRFTRFAAAMVDGLLMIGIIMPIQFATGYAARLQNAQVSALEQLGMSLLALLSFLVLNGYLLSSRGQTIGKYLTKIQIIDDKTNKLLPFVRVYVFRYLWTLPIAIVVQLIPSVFDDLLLNIVVLIDVLFIFGPERRCLHDYIAGSKVVLFQENRER